MFMRATGTALVMAVATSAAVTTQTVPQPDTLISCAIGSYRSLIGPFGPCSGFKPCEPGSFCSNGEKQGCPPGTFGETPRLTNSSCSGACPPGYYCPIRTISPYSYRCGNASLYCPSGSGVPLAVPSGYYSVDTTGSSPESTEQTRSGLLRCPRGSYCVDGVKRLCPGGTFGDSTGLGDARCSGECPEGFHCPLGTAFLNEYTCGVIPTQYCPVGSSRPLPTAQGYYAVSAASYLNAIAAAGATYVTEEIIYAAGFGSQLVCPRGSYCVSGVRYDCTGGRYGDVEGSSNPECSGICYAGWYCPSGSSRGSQLPCGDSSYYCPAGSSAPQQVTIGYYTTVDHTRNNTIDANVNGDGGLFFRTLTASDHQKCEPGFYCLADGVRRPCPAGRYGSTYGLGTLACSGACNAGYYCPAGSAREDEIECGGEDVFCPVGSPEPQKVQRGYYTVTINGGSTISTANPGPTVRAAERLCSPGSYCVNGTRILCPAGTYTSRFGESNSTCAGQCSAGYYCPEGSDTATEVMCGDADRFCPEGSGRPTSVTPGYYSSGSGFEATRSYQSIAPRGFYALRGLLFRCRPGYYGDSVGLTSPYCSGPCIEAGFYCPAGSVSPTMRACGGDNVYCPPIGLGAPLPVHAGAYTADYLFERCPPGKWRNWTQSYDPTLVTPLHHIKSDIQSVIPTIAITPPCELCPLGKYKAAVGDDLSLCLDCDSRYAGSTADRMTCFCTSIIDRTSPTPAPVSGYEGESATTTFTSADMLALAEASVLSSGEPEMRTGAQILGLPLEAIGQNTGENGLNSITIAGSSEVEYGLMFNITTGKCLKLFESQIVLSNDGLWPRNTSITRSIERPCEPGHYCVGGLRYVCSAGTYTGQAGETNPSCAGLCAAGYYCPAASVSPYTKPCGAANLYCPKGSGAPKIAPEGFYTNEDTARTLRSSILPCSPGYYCPGDGLRYPCPAGRYSDGEGASTDQCMGPCESGYWCEQGSADPQQHKCGGSMWYCPQNSPQPNPVHIGFYSIFTGADAGAKALWDTDNTTASAELPCEPGYYCIDGVKHPCPPGMFGWRYGMNTSSCGGACAPGYYCPSYMEPVPDAPPETKWPLKPHTSSAELVCGAVQFYCPKGSMFPSKVQAGYYSTGGGENVTIRSSQEPCPLGYYCKGGVRIQCPKGRYGNTTGLSVELCSGWCPAGNYCPLGTGAPIPCPENHYSTAAAWKCTACPGYRTLPLNCQDDRGCCFRGL